ncbi:TetR/AcrR family transcriptional regulator [Lysinimonas soli]|uniref:TetR/AcrR family transcriptional regulator n=1 Tax=Lysinimonas soli TaxID=1074233 RepID=A0ABW0NPZ0_9MICO
MSIDRGIRGDAARNRDAILDAALEGLADDPRTSMTDIAARAGLGRVTLYGHFSSRDELIEAAMIRTIERSEAELATADLSGDPVEALKRLVDRSWRIVHNFHVLLGVAETALSNDQIREHHGKPLTRVQQLIERGQSEGRMRPDVTAEWLTACVMAILHEAAAQVRAGRMTDADAAHAASVAVIAIVSLDRA